MVLANVGESFNVSSTILLSPLVGMLCNLKLCFICSGLQLGIHLAALEVCNLELCVIAFSLHFPRELLSELNTKTSFLVEVKAVNDHAGHQKEDGGVRSGITVELASD